MNNSSHSSTRRRRRRPPVGSGVTTMASQQQQQPVYYEQENRNDPYENYADDEEDEDDDELKPLTPREGTDENNNSTVVASFLSPAVPVDQDIQYPFEFNNSSGRVSVSSSAMAAAQNHWMRFDDQGQSSSYLQFFKSPSRYYHPTRNFTHSTVYQEEEVHEMEEDAESGLRRRMRPENRNYTIQRKSPSIASSKASPVSLSASSTSTFSPGKKHWRGGPTVIVPQSRSLLNASLASPSDVSCTQSSSSSSSSGLLSLSTATTTPSNSQTDASSLLYDDENVPVPMFPQQQQSAPSLTSRRRVSSATTAPFSLYPARPAFSTSSSSSSSDHTRTPTANNDTPTPWSCPYPNPYYPDNDRAALAADGAFLFGETIPWTSPQGGDSSCSPRSITATTTRHAWWNSSSHNSSRRQHSTSPTPVTSLAYWQEQHERKMKSIRPQPPQNGDYDFVLLLQPQAVYAFWADHLDFRHECLGPAVTKAMEDAWQEQDQAVAALAPQPQQSFSVVSETSTLFSWATSVLRRRGATTPTSSSVASSVPAFDLYKVDDTTKKNTFNTTASIFDRALLEETHAQQQPQTPFRRWGVQPVTTTMSTATTATKATATKVTPRAPSSSPRHPNVLRMEDIPETVIARGIAARTNRTNGLLPFLNALAARPSRLTLRLHRPGFESCSIQLSSPDGGDTLQTTSLWPPLRSVSVSDILAVHPARNLDATGQLGTVSLRKSKSVYCPERTFSIVVSRHHQQQELEWHHAPPGQFRYIDLEADTLEEYWVVFRGILLLHRDAMVGRFAKHRAAGMMGGGHHHRIPLHVDEYHEPATAGFFERRFVSWFHHDDTHLQGFLTQSAKSPPPSDYFLGFKSPGTALWARLRFAGLETARVYQLNPSHVMMKVKCPADRLVHVAEVLKLQPPLTHDDGPVFFGTFRSSVRQTIIDFIIGSRIRDSGAELGPSSDLGSMITNRVPLHKPEQLERVFQPWFYFWRREHWSARRGKREKEEMPNVVTRFILGSFSQPLDDIEEYYGEKVAFYFTWLQHTASHLVFLSVPGLILFVCMLVDNNFLHPLRVVFSIVVMMWTFIVLLNWKKRANMMAYRWGTMNYKEQETTRPQFKGDYVQDEITGEWIVHYPKWKRWLKYSISFPLTMFFTAGTLVLILWVHANRDLQLKQYLEVNTYGVGEEYAYEGFALSAIGKRPVLDVKFTRQDFFKPQFWFIVVGMPSMLGLFLPLLNFILMRLSIWLNDFENYRTESEYRTYLIIKVFSFRFVCYFATLYYYAFVSSIVSEEEKDSRNELILNGVLRVGSGVLVYTTVAQWWQNTLQTCFPLLIRRIRMNHRRQRLADELRAIELEEERVAQIARVENVEPATLKDQRIRLVNKRLLLDQAQDPLWLELMNPQHDSFPEYIQAVVQFTFVSCFSVVLPITPVLVLINYLISMRLDAYKLCKTRRRPLAEKTGGIGVWEHVLHIVAVISVLTNCWLIGFTSPQFLDLLDGKNGIGDLGLFALVVGWEHIMLLIKYVMSTSMSPFPRSVRDAMKKQQYETDKQRNTLMMERRRFKSPTKQIPVGGAEV